MQTAFALSGMLDPTFLVVHSAGTGRDTSMLEGLMQVEGERCRVLDGAALLHDAHDAHLLLLQASPLEAFL